MHFSVRLRTSRNDSCPLEPTDRRASRSHSYESLAQLLPTGPRQSDCGESDATTSEKHGRPPQRTQRTLHFTPRGSTMSGQHSKLRYPCLYLVFLWSNPT
jgi:hypothetical protein